jgi:hypothetical protein
MSPPTDSRAGDGLPPPWAPLAVVVRGLRSRAPEPGAPEGAARALDLADAVIRDLAATRDEPPPPPQVAVVGPTQAGKSTVVNLLLGENAAGVSPLAGFTVHAEGFTTDPHALGRPWLRRLFPDAEQVPREALARDRYDQFSVSVLNGPAQRERLRAGTMVWDTPDFDSLAADHYRRGVLGVVAMADVIVMVVSREKYADLSVWRLLELIAPLRRRLIVCLNKATPDSTGIITGAIEARLAEAGLGATPVHAVPLDPAIGRGESGPGAGGLLDAVRSAAATAQRPRPSEGAGALVGAWWEAWTAPVRSEHDALERWSQKVEAGVAAAVETYRRDYLDDPRRYDAFRRAVVELLVLLEPPALAGTLGRARRVLGWPARWLWGAVRPRRGETAASEMLVLDEALDHLLTGLAVDSARGAEPGQPGAAVWGALHRRLSAAEPGIRAEFSDAAARHRAAFEPEIQRAAGRLYTRLKEHPRLLNSLRAARISADVAGVVLAVKSGGLGLHDLLFAPAVLSLTSTLTESALGAYMKQVADDLKRRQLEAVTERVFGIAARPALMAVSAPGGAGADVTPAMLREADAALDRLRHEGY